MAFSSVMNQEAMEKKDGAGGLFSDLGVDGSSSKDKDSGGSGKGGSGGAFLTGLSLMMPVKPMLALYVINPVSLRLLTSLCLRSSSGIYTKSTSSSGPATV